VAITDGIAEYYLPAMLRIAMQAGVFGMQICRTKSSAFSEIRPRLSMVEHDQDFICAVITDESFGSGSQQSESVKKR